MGQYAGDFRRIALRAVRARHLLSIDRPPIARHDRHAAREGPARISASVALRARHRSPRGSGAGAESRQRPLPRPASCRNWPAGSTTRRGRAWTPAVTNSIWTEREPRDHAVRRQLPARAESRGDPVVHAARCCRAFSTAMPQARLVLVGSDPPPPHSLPAMTEARRVARVRRGYPRAARPLLRYSSARSSAGRECGLSCSRRLRPVFRWFRRAWAPRGWLRRMERSVRLRMNPRSFARRVIELFEDREKAARMACAARELVTRERDARVLTERLEREYRALLASKRRGCRRRRGAQARGNSRRRRRLAGLLLELPGKIVGQLVEFVGLGVAGPLVLRPDHVARVAVAPGRDCPCCGRRC